jgi:hypothetical protein
VRVRLVGAPGFVISHQLDLGEIQDGVVRGHLVRGALERAFGAGAVVAADVDDERVVELAHVLDGLDHAADLVVGIGGIGGKHFRLARIQFLAHERERIPFRKVCRPRSELRIRGDDTKPLLVGEDLLAQLLPAHVELALEFFDPLLLWLVRRVGAAGDVVEEERLFGRSPR